MFVPKNHLTFTEIPEFKFAACQCSVTGSLGSDCDTKGKCTCKDEYTGDKCDECKTDFDKIGDECKGKEKVVCPF